MKNDLIIMSLGGSIVCPKTPDVNFLKKFKKFILSWIKKGKKFIIFVGGGKIAREYQKAGKSLGIKNRDFLDWLGIYATRLNAELLKDFFSPLSMKKIILYTNKKIELNKKINIGAGLRPGHSTDYDAIRMAKQFNVKKVINLSNVEYIYDKNPKKFKDAEPIFEINASDLLKKHYQWKAGLNFPVDPMSLILMKKEGINFYNLDGRNFKNINNLLRGKKFKGTLIYGI